MNLIWNIIKGLTKIQQNLSEKQTPPVAISNEPAPDSNDGQTAPEPKSTAPAAQEKKEAIRDELRSRGIDLEAMKEESKQPRISKKSDDILTYILADNKEAIVCFLHQALKGQKTAKGIARPFRFLFDHQLTEHIPFKAVMKEFPELKGLIKVRSYNDWTNPNSTSYDNDPQYKKMKDTFKLFS